MNEQITKLDRQAKIWAMENTNYPISTYIPPGYTEKLAELIVKECCDAADMARDADYNFPGDYIGEHMGYGLNHGIADWRCE